MNFVRWFRFGWIGALAAFFAWLCAEPFAYTAATHGRKVGGVQFTFGSFFGWFGFGMLGGCVCGTLVLFLARERLGWGKSFIRAGIAFLVGGVLGAGSDAVSDLIGMRILSTKDVSILSLFGMEFVWQMFVSLAIALSIAVTSFPSWDRTKRMLFGGFVTGVLTFIIRSQFVPIFEVIDLMRVGQDKSVAFVSFGLGRLVDHAAMGFLLGTLLASSETMLASAMVRWRKGRNEAQDFPLMGFTNRIGSVEGIEVALFGAVGVAPVHAAIQYDRGIYYLVDGGSPAGTWLTGERISRERLEDGDTFQIGDATLIFLEKSASGSGQWNEKQADISVSVRQRRWLVDSFGNLLDMPLGELTVGRDSGCWLSITYDASVSRAHARFNVTTDRIWLEDVGSANGTTVNGVMLMAPREMVDGDQIGFGNAGFTLRFEN